MAVTDVVLYVPPFLFSIVSLAFFVLWVMNITPAWQWSAGFAQTAAGFVISTFVSEPVTAAFVSGVIFIGAAYCYGTGLLVHFDAPKMHRSRGVFSALYILVLGYVVIVEQSLVQQLFLTDICFAILLASAVFAVARRASRAIDIALVVATSVVVLDSVVRATFFTFFTNLSDNLGDFANSLYNIEVSVSTITVCMFFPFIALGASASAAIERHQAASEVDELTGLLNRRGFKRVVNYKDGLGELHGSFLVFDIDHFKNINDTFGHDVGDQVIEGLATTIKRLLPPGSSACRYGGEEFVVFVPDATLAEAQAFAEGVRSSVEGTRWARHDEVAATVSCGVATTRPAETSEAAVDRADRALYSAKSSGRNKVCAEATNDILSEQRAPVALVSLVKTSDRRAG